MRENTNLAAQNMPPEFQFKPTRIYYDEPPGSIIYEDAMGSSGKAPIDAMNQRRMDPIHWSRGKGVENMQRTAQGLISHLTHTHQYSQTPRTIIRKHVDRRTVNTTIKEPKSFRQPRVKGYRTPQEVARGAKLKDFKARPPVDRDKLAMITDPRRGFRRGQSRALMSHLAKHPAAVEAMAQRIQRRQERELEERIRVGGAELTKSQYASLPPGYVKELIRRQRLRDARQERPQVMFDPRESKGMSPNGQYSNIAKAGLVEIEDGKWVKPEQVGMAPDAAIGALGDNAQPVSKLGAKDALVFGGLLIGAIVGGAFLLGR